MGGLGLTLGYLKLGVWLSLAVETAAVFILLIFIRITVPRFRLESLSRLGWSTLLVLLSAVGGVYVLGLWLG